MRSIIVLGLCGSLLLLTSCSTQQDVADAEVSLDHARRDRRATSGVLAVHVMVRRIVTGSAVRLAMRC